MVTVDKFILRRPSLKELGVENKVTTLLNEDFVKKQIADGYTIEPGWEKIQTIVNWDRTPNIVVGVVGHEEDGVLRLYSAKYICDRLTNEIIADESGKFKVIISKDSLGVCKLPELLQRKELYEFAYDFIYDRKMVLPVAVEPQLVKDNKVKYRKGRVFIPAMLIKEKYCNLLVTDYSEFNQPLENTNNIDRSESKKNSTTLEDPIFLYIKFGMEYLENNPEKLQEEMDKITEDDMKKYNTDNKRRIIGIKLSLGEIDVPIE